MFCMSNMKFALIFSVCFLFAVSITAVPGSAMIDFSQLFNNLFGGAPTGMVDETCDEDLGIYCPSYDDHCIDGFCRNDVCVSNYECIELLGDGGYCDFYATDFSGVEYGECDYNVDTETTEDEPDCIYNYNCPYWEQHCENGVCVDGCETADDCEYSDEECIAGECVADDTESPDCWYCGGDSYQDQFDDDGICMGGCGSTDDENSYCYDSDCVEGSGDGSGSDGGDCDGLDQTGKCVTDAILLYCNMDSNELVTVDCERVYGSDYVCGFDNNNEMYDCILSGTDSDTNIDVECTKSPDCDPFVCINNECDYCSNDAQCSDYGNGYVCDFLGGNCVSGVKKESESWTTCTPETMFEDCLWYELCIDGECMDNYAGYCIDAEFDCASWEDCVDSICVDSEDVGTDNCATGCYASMKGDGTCDPDCNVDACDKDYGDCEDDGKLGWNQRDCDSDSDCVSPLVCTQVDAGALDFLGIWGWISDDYCCNPGEIVEEGKCLTPQQASEKDCTTASPCKHGEYDCDRNDECGTFEGKQLVCKQPSGGSLDVLGIWGWVSNDYCCLPEEVVSNGKCLTPEQAGEKKCSSTDPCKHGEGDCNYDSDCKQDDVNGKLFCKSGGGVLWGIFGENSDFCCFEDEVVVDGACSKNIDEKYGNLGYNEGQCQYQGESTSSTSGSGIFAFGKGVISDVAAGYSGCTQGLGNCPIVRNADKLLGSTAGTSNNQMCAETGKNSKGTSVNLECMKSTDGRAYLCCGPGEKVERKVNVKTKTSGYQCSDADSLAKMVDKSGTKTDATLTNALKSLTKSSTVTRKPGDKAARTGKGAVPDEKRTKVTELEKITPKITTEQKAICAAVCGDSIYDGPKNADGCKDVLYGIYVQGASIEECNEYTTKDANGKPCFDCADICNNVGRSNKDPLCDMSPGVCNIMIDLDLVKPVDETSFAPLFNSKSIKACQAKGDAEFLPYDLCAMWSDANNDPVCDDTKENCEKAQNKVTLFKGTSSEKTVVTKYSPRYSLLCNEANPDKTKRIPDYKTDPLKKVKYDYLVANKADLLDALTKIAKSDASDLETTEKLINEAISNKYTWTGTATKYCATDGTVYLIDSADIIYDKDGDELQDYTISSSSTENQITILSSDDSAAPIDVTKCS